MRAFSFLESYEGKDTQAISSNEYNRVSGWKDLGSEIFPAAYSSVT